MDVWRIVKLVDDLEGGRLLPLDTCGVDAVDQRHGVLIGEISGEVQAVIEVAVDLQQSCAVGKGLTQLAQCDLSLWDQDGAHHARAHRIGSRAGAGVSG